jgi:hypothetical protein
MWTKAFWKGSVERAIRVLAWTLIAQLAGPNVSSAVGVDLLNIGWRDALSISFGAALLSILFSLAVSAVGPGPEGSASMVFDRPKDDK